MTVFKYKDPYRKARYNSSIDIPIDEDMPPEQFQEIQDFLDADYRRIKNQERGATAHQWSYEGQRYEGAAYAYSKTPEWIYLKKEQAEELLDSIDALTETQRRRFLMWAIEGLSIREVARRENANYSSVKETIESAQKILQKNISFDPINLPDFNPHYGGHHIANPDDDDNYD